MKPGTKLKSAVCDTEVMVIRGTGVAPECGGAPMSETRSGEPKAIDPAFAAGTKIGKRYVDAAGTCELLCVKDKARSPSAELRCRSKTPSPYPHPTSSGHPRWHR